jgi:hypothetical protein
MPRSTALRAAVVAVAVGLVCVLANAASALSWSQTYANGDVTVTIVGDGVAEWNNLYQPVGPNDVLGDFSTTTPNWAVTSVGPRGASNTLRLTRTPATKIGETVVISGPLNRGNGGRVSLTLDGATVITTPHGHTFLLVDEGPGLSPWGTVILVSLLLGVGVFAVTRKRTQVA